MSVMSVWVILRRARITLLCILALICLIWATLLAVFLSQEWSHFSRFQEVLVISLLSLYGFTAIFLYLMVVTCLRLWSDIGRLFVLFVAQMGSSVLLTIYNPSFPCLNFGTEAACREIVHAIFIGSWVVVSGILLCLLIALGVMTFVPQPVEPLKVTEGGDAPSTHTWFCAGNPTNERQTSFFYSIDSRTGFVTYNNGGKSPDFTPFPASGAHGETITMGSPPLRHGSESPNMRHGNNTHRRTMPMANVPTEHTSIIPKPRRLGSFHHSPHGNPPSRPASVYSRAPMTRSHYSVAASPGDYSQREQTYAEAPDRARRTRSIHTSMWLEPTSHTSSLPVLTPEVARLRGSSSHLGSKGPSPGKRIVPE